MTRSRRALIGMVAVLAAWLGLAPPAQAAPDQTLKGLVLSGSCPDQGSLLKNIVATPRTHHLWAPLRLWDSTFTPTGKWLFPSEITVTGEGLKTRHLTPGVTYVRPGPAPRRAVATCVFDGATKEDGPFQVAVTGVIRP